jgi:5-methyltetrahydropteroyltriglutamate--homocysteine methyltransferase
MMIQSCDVGSLPFTGDLEKFLLGATSFNSRIQLPYATAYSDSAVRNYFEDKVMEGFLDKVNAGIDIPNYPQFRDMSEMFLTSVDGVEKTKGGYVTTGIMSIQSEKVEIPEVSVLRKKSHEIYNKISRPFRLKVCVTGPYTLSSIFLYRENELLNQLGDIVSRIVEGNIFSSKYSNVEFIAIDEPVFGLLDDPQLDYGSDGREVLLEAWERIFHKAKSRNTRTCLHLHNTSNEMFWELKSLDVVESHIDDLLYHSDRTKKLLEEKDKFLKASIGITDFDRLIRNSMILSSKQLSEAAIGQRVSEIWTDIYKGKSNPIIFLETVEKMKERLARIIDRFSRQRVPYAGLECGLKSFPAYESAIEYLKRLSESVYPSKFT